MSDVRQGNPRARSRELRLALIIFVLGLLAVVLYLAQQDTLIAWLLSHTGTITNYPWLVLIVMLLLMSPLIVFGGYLMQIGNRVLASEEFPPPGLVVARDTPVLRGADAVQRARLIQVMGLMLMIAGVVAAVLLQQAVVRLLLQAA